MGPAMAAPKLDVTNRARPVEQYPPYGEPQRQILSELRRAVEWWQRSNRPRSPHNHEAKQRHSSRDAADLGEDTPSPEALQAWARSRLEDPTLREDERDTLMDYLSGWGR